MQDCPGFRIQVSVCINQAFSRNIRVTAPRHPNCLTNSIQPLSKRSHLPATETPQCPLMLPCWIIIAPAGSIVEIVGGTMVPKDLATVRNIKTCAPFTDCRT